MTDLSTLLSRVESGGGADRETDCFVWAFAEGVELEWQGTTLVAGEHGVIGWIDPGKYSRNFGCNRATSGPGSVPAYTTDLSAVVALVEARLPGWRWMVRRMEPQPGAPSQYAAYVQNTEDGLYCWRAASIAARALLAALIRAEMEKVK